MLCTSESTPARPASDGSSKPRPQSKRKPSFQESRSTSSVRPDIPGSNLPDDCLTPPPIPSRVNPPIPTLQHEDRLRAHTPYPPGPYPSLHSPGLSPTSYPQPHHHLRPQGREQPSRPQATVTSVAGDTSPTPGSASLEVPKQFQLPGIASASRYIGGQ